MARTESQLEIYKIILGRKTMRQIIIEKEHIEEAIDDNIICLIVCFLECFMQLHKIPHGILIGQK